MTEPTRITQKEAAAFFDMTPRTLKNWEAEDWFPDEGRTDEGYSVELIAEAKSAAEQSVSSVTILAPERFKPTCPRSEHHAARVRKTDGRIRHCICESCGHEFKQIGPENHLKQLLSTIGGELGNLQTHDVNGEQVVILRAVDRDAIVAICEV